MIRWLDTLDTNMLLFDGQLCPFELCRSQMAHANAPPVRFLDIILALHTYLYWKHIATVDSARRSLPDPGQLNAYCMGMMIHVDLQQVVYATSSRVSCLLRVDTR